MRERESQTFTQQLAQTACMARGFGARKPLVDDPGPIVVEHPSKVKTRRRSGNFCRSDGVQPRVHARVGSPHERRVAAAPAGEGARIVGAPRAGIRQRGKIARLKCMRTRGAARGRTTSRAISVVTRLPSMRPAQGSHHAGTKSYTFSHITFKHRRISAIAIRRVYRPI